MQGRKMTHSRKLFLLQLLGQQIHLHHRHRRMRQHGGHPDHEKA